MKQKFKLMIKYFICCTLLMSSVFPFHSAFSVVTTTDSSSPLVDPTTTPRKPNAPFVLYSGYFNNSTGSANISPGCPTGFTAYPTLEGGEQQLTTPLAIATQSNYCLHTFTQTPSTITLSISRVANYSTFSVLSNNSRYMAVLNWAYGAGTSRAFPQTINIGSDTTNDEPTAIKNVHFIVNCYPTGTQPATLTLC
jgi:hypothetical protein